MSTRIRDTEPGRGYITRHPRSRTISEGGPARYAGRLGRGDMSKRSLNTPRSQIRSALRKLWLRSRERASAIKRDGYCCQHCGRKQSKTKGKEFSVEVHHLPGICNWDEIFRIIYEYLLCDPAKMHTLCPECHKGMEGSTLKQQSASELAKNDDKRHPG